MVIALLSAHGSPVCLRRKHLLSHNKPRCAAGKRNHVGRLLYTRPLSAAAVISLLIVTLLRHYHTHQILLMEMMMEKDVNISGKSPNHGGYEARNREMSRFLQLEIEFC